MSLLTYIRSVADFFQRRGEIRFRNSFLSPRLVREALESRFRLVSLEETSTHLRFKVIRLFRVYGGPMIWPQAQIDISIRKENDGHTLSWYFYWPEYYSLFPWPVVFGLGTWNEVPIPLSMLPIGIFFSGLLIFLDTMWVAGRVRKAFLGGLK